MSEPIRILIVEDLESDFQLAQLEIRKSVEDCVFEQADTRLSFLEALETFQPDVILSDYSLPRFDGMTALKLAKEQAPLTPFIIWTGSMSEDIAVKCMKAGANNYILKENLKRLGPAIVHSIEERHILVERQRAIEALQESEARYHGIFEGAQDAIFLASLEGDILDINQRACQIYGYTHEEFLTKKVSDLVPSEEYIIWFNKEFDIHGKTLETLNVRSNGERFPVEISGGTYEINGLKSFLIVLRDITERKLAEQKYQDIFEQSQEGIFLSTPEGRFIKVNPAMARIYGYDSPEDMIQSITSISSQIYIDPRDRDEFTLSLHAEDHLDRFEMKNLRKDGSILWISTSARAVRDTDGNILYYEGFLQDITERKLAEIETLQRNDDLRLINAINEAALHDVRLEEIVDLLAREFKHIFSSMGSTVYLLTADGKSLNMQQYLLPPEIQRQVERLIGSTIPLIQIPIQEGGFLNRVLNSQHGFVTSDREEIQQWMMEFLETPFLPKAAKEVIRKLIPQIFDVLNIRSTIAIPLLLNGKAIGILDVSSTALFTENDLHRIENVSRQLTAALQRQEANEQLRRSEEFLQSVQNALSTSIAILDENGVIVQINSAWRKFGEQNGLRHPEYCIGLNYLDICDTATGPNSEEAHLVARAIREVITGQRREVQVEYPCHSPEDKRWFTLRITQFDDGDHIWVVLAHENITERKQSEEAARETSEQFRTLFEASPEAIMLVDPQGDWKIMDCNPAGCAMNGYTREELIGQSVNIFNLTPGDPEERAGYLERIRKDGILRFETLHRRKDGSVFPIDVSTSLITLGGREMILGIDRDITESKQAEEALRKSEALYRQAMEVAGAVPYYESYNNNGNSIKYEFIGEGIRQITGYRPDEFNAQVWDSLVEEVKLIEDLKGYSLEEGIQLVRFGGHPIWRCEHRLRDREGKIHWVFEAAVELRDENGSAYGSIGTYQDITARKAAEEEVRKANEKYRNIFENAMEAIHQTTPDGRYLTANPATARMLGYESAEALMASVTDLDHHLYVDAGRREEFKALMDENGFVSRFESEVYRKDGSTIWVSENVRAIRDEQGNLLYYEGTSQDITERKQAEEAERDQRALAEALRDTSETLNSTLEYKDVLDHILAAVGHVVPHDAGTIMLIEGEFARVVRLHGYDKRGFKDEIMGIKLPLAETNNLRQMFETGQPLIVYDTHSYVGWKKMPITDWLRSNVGAPISIYGEIIGFILLDSGKIGFFTPVHAERLKAFANQAAIAIQNSRLLKQAQEEIIERKRAEEELRQSESRYRTVVENQTEFIVRWTPDGTRMFVNDAYCHYFGITREQALTTNFMPLVYEEDQPAIDKKISRLLSGSIQMETDIHRVIKPDGSIGWQEWTDQAIYAENGQLIEFQSVGRDITERMKAEQELRASEERFRQLAENIQEVFWMTDAITGNELYISPTAEKIWGHSPEDLMTDSNAFIESIYPEDLPAVQQMLAMQRAGQPTSVEYRTLRPNGSICWVWDRAFPIFDETGKVVRLAGIAADITERKQAQDKLHESEERYRQLLSVAPIGVAVHINGKIVFANAKGASIFGANSPEELIGKPIMDFVPPEDRLYTMSIIQRMMQGEQGLYPREEKFVRMDGTIITVEVFAISVNYMDSIAIQVIVQDITERKQVEEALRKNEQRLRIALAGTNIAVFNQDMDLRYTWMYQPQLGYTSEQVMGKTDADLLSPQDAPSIMEIKRRALVTGKPERAETSIHSPDGTAYYDLIVEPLLDNNGTIIGIAGSTLDITDHKNSELEIRRHLTELEALHENGLAVGRLLNPREIGECVIHTFARHLSWHHVTIRLTQPGSDTLELIAFSLPGLSEEEKANVEQHFQSMISKVGQGLSGWVAQTGEAVRTGNVHAYPQYINTLAGIQSGLYMPLKIGERVLGVISVESEEPDAFTAQDERLLATLATQAAIAFENARLYQSAQLEITERKRAEKELRESQERYQLLVETSPDGIGMMDMQGNILFGNYQMAELFHVEDPSKLIGTNMISLVAPESQAEVMEYLGTPLPEGAIHEGLWLARKDGTHFFGEMRTSALQNDMGEQYAIIGQVRDVTEREQARLAIHEERQRFLDLFENSPVATWLEDFSAVIAWMNGLKEQGVVNLKDYLEKNNEAYKLGISLINILDVNHAAVVMNGARDKTELLKSVHELMMDEMPSQVVIHEMEMIWRGYTSFGFEMSSQKLDGTIITGAQRIYIPFVNNEPDYKRVIVTNTDITDRVVFEQRLRSSEVHYRELADSITDVFFELDQDIRFSHWNKASEILTGFPAEHAIGKSMQEVFGKSSGLERIELVFREVREKHQPKMFETIIPLQSQFRTFEINAYPSTRGVAVVAKDVTERKLSELLMEKRFELMEYSAQQDLSGLMQKTLDEISGWTQSPIGFFQLIKEDQISPGLQVWSTDMFENFYSSPGAEMHKPADQAGVWAEAIRLRKAVIHNDYKSMPGKKGLPEGHSPLIRELVLPIIRNEKIVAVIGIGNKSQEYTSDDLEITERFTDYAWDIIERKQMVLEIAEERNQLARRVEERTADLSRANSNLARALRVKDEFLASMSHELRTPLNAILGLSESLSEQIAGPLNEKQQKYLTTISESGHHLLSLINDILDLAKIEAGQITLDINKVDVNLVSQASLRMIKQLAQKKNLDVAVEIDQKIGLMWADERRLKQMMVNLLSNAVKFTPEGGKLGLQIQGDQEDNKVMITVWDTGIGIREADFQRLFRPFVQLDSGLAREATGTGLGLALVAQMARLHGGSVNVTSEPGQGSRFTIVLPWQPAQAMTIAEKLKVTGKFRAIKDRQGPQTILLVEDTQEVVMMIKDYLEIAGYKVITAQDGLDGITQAKLSHPDLILMDVQMPRMDGLEATKKLRQDPEFKQTPIIALTALAMPNDRERCLAAGMDEYISKPVNLRALVKIIQSCLSIREEKTTHP